MDGDRTDPTQMNSTRASGVLVSPGTPAAEMMKLTDEEQSCSRKEAELLARGAEVETEARKVQVQLDEVRGELQRLASTPSHLDAENAFMRSLAIVVPPHVASPATATALDQRRKALVARLGAIQVEENAVRARLACLQTLSADIASLKSTARALASRAGLAAAAVSAPEDDSTQVIELTRKKVPSTAPAIERKPLGRQDTSEPVLLGTPVALQGQKRSPGSPSPGLPSTLPLERATPTLVQSVSPALLQQSISPAARGWSEPLPAPAEAVTPGELRPQVPAAIQEAPASQGGQDTAERTLVSPPEEQPRGADPLSAIDSRLSTRSAAASDANAAFATVPDSGEPAAFGVEKTQQMFRPSASILEAPAGPPTPSRHRSHRKGQDGDDVTQPNLAVPSFLLSPEEPPPAPAHRTQPMFPAPAESPAQGAAPAGRLASPATAAGPLRIEPAPGPVAPPPVTGAPAEVVAPSPQTSLVGSKAGRSITKPLFAPNMPVPAQPVPAAAPVPAPAAAPSVAAPPEPDSTEAPTKVSGPGKRGSPRARMQTEITLGSDSNFYSGFSGDISETGLFVATYDKLLPPGTPVDLTVKLPGGPALQLKGKVRWVRDSSDRAPGVFPGMGISFEQISAGDAKLIRSFLKMREPMFWSE